MAPDRLAQLAAIGRVLTVRRGDAPAGGGAVGRLPADVFTTDAAAAVAAARGAAEPLADVPALLAEIEALRGELAYLRATQATVQPMPAWQARQNRLDARDHALRQAVAATEAPDRTAACRVVALAWAAAIRGAAVRPELAPHLARAIQMHGDRRPLSWVQVANIARASRTPIDAGP